MRPHSSPLRYPGGKARAVSQLLAYFPIRPGTLVSPFFGGGSLELTLARRGWRVMGYDLFQPLVDFWQQALTNPEQLADEVAKHHPLSVEAFKHLQVEGSQLPTQLERASAFYVLNRSSFSGSTCSGGMSPGHERFNQAAIERLRNFRAPNLWIECADFTESIPAHPNAFLYLDPPYVTARGLYGSRGSLHNRFDHRGLRDVLSHRGQWVLSYGDCQEVRALYRGRRILPVQWSYGMNATKRSNEVVILSDDLPAPCALCAERLKAADPMATVLAELRRDVAQMAAREG